MNENVLDSNNLLGSENRQKRHSIPTSPKRMMSQTPRTPLMDVKNRLCLQQRSRRSTGCVKTTDNRMDVLDEGLLDHTRSRKVNVFKEPSDEECIEQTHDASNPLQPKISENMEAENVLQENWNIVHSECTKELLEADDSLKTASPVSTLNHDNMLSMKSAQVANTLIDPEGNSNDFYLRLEALRKSFDLEMSEETLGVVENEASLGELEEELLSYSTDELVEGEHADSVDTGLVISQLWGLIGETHRSEGWNTDKATELTAVGAEDSESPLDSLPELCPSFSCEHDLGTSSETTSSLKSPHDYLLLDDLEMNISGTGRLELLFSEKEESVGISNAEDSLVNLSACDLAEEMEIILSGEFNEETRAMSADDVPFSSTIFCSPAEITGDLPVDGGKLVADDVLNVSTDDTLANEPTDGLESSLNSSILEHAEALNFFEPSDQVLKLIDEFLKHGSTLEDGCRELSINCEKSEEENDQNSSSTRNEHTFDECVSDEELSVSMNREVSTISEETTVSNLVNVNKKLSSVKRRSYSTKISRVMESLREACGSADSAVKSSTCPEQSEMIPKSYIYSQLLAADSLDHATADAAPHINVTTHETSDPNLKCMYSSILENDTEVPEDFEHVHGAPSLLDLQTGLKILTFEHSSPNEPLKHAVNEDSSSNERVIESVKGDRETTPTELEECQVTLSGGEISENLAATDLSVVDEGNETEDYSMKSEILPVRRHSSEIQSLVSQMLEIKQKIKQLEEYRTHVNPDCLDRNMGKGQSSDIMKTSEGELREEKLLVSDLQAQLDGRNKRVEELEVQLSEERLKCDNLEEQVTEVEKKCSVLEKKHLMAELNFAKELQRLKSEYAQSVYHEKEALEESSQEICEEFDGMISEVERLTILQGKLKDMLNRVIHTTNGSLTGYTKLLKDYSTLHQNHSTVKKHLSAVEKDNTRLKEDVQVLEDLLRRSNDSLDKLSLLYTEADMTSQADMEKLRSKVTSLSEALEKATEEKARLETGLEEYSTKFQHSLDLLETECQVRQDKLNDTEFLLEHQKQLNQTLKEEVGELRKVKADWEMGKTLIKELQDSVSFLNEEREATLLEHTSELEEMMGQVTMLKEEVESLIAANGEYQNSQDSLQTEVSCLREELYLTKTDINSVLLTLEQVETRVDSVLETLQDKFGFDMSSDSFKATPTHLSVSHSSQAPTSLVAHVLNMAEADRQQQQSAHRSDTKVRQFVRQSNVEYGSCSKKCSSKGPSSRKALRFSSPRDAEKIGREKPIDATSATVPNQHPDSSRDIEDNDDRLNTSVPGFAHIRSIPLSGERSEDEGRSATMSEASADLNVVDLCENLVVSIEEKLSLILKIAHAADRVSRKSIKELRGEVDCLTEKAQMKQRRLERAESEIEGVSHLLEESRSEVSQLNERVNSMVQAILKHEDLTYDVKRLEEENGELKQAMSNVKGEKDMLTAHLQKLITKVHGGEDVQAGLNRIVALEKKNYDLHCFLFQEKEKNKEKVEKAMRRIRVLEMNWRKAEDEVFKFDELVEAIRNTCIASRSVHSHPALLHIRRLIDGLTEVGQKASSKKESRLSGAGSSQSSKMSAATPQSSQSSKMSAATSQSSLKSSEQQEFPV